MTRTCRKRVQQLIATKQCCFMQVTEARSAAHEFKDELVEKGVFIVPLPLEDGDDVLPALEKDDSGSSKCAYARTCAATTS